MTADSPAKPLRVALVGCGKIADDHLRQIGRIPDCVVVGACDREPLMARQACERFRIPHACGSVEELLEVSRPDVVHITTPPQGHFSIASQCLAGGCHVYVEKPFTVDEPEAVSLLQSAEARGLKVTVGHDLQFSPAALWIREQVRSGYLGGPPVHMESAYCYDLSDPRYARVLLADRQHWVRRLPGGLLHNLISHGIARIAEYLPEGPLEVLAHGFISDTLRGIGEDDIVDELRVILRATHGATAYFTFSSQMRPSLNEFRLFGPANGLYLDEDAQRVLRLRGSPFKSYANKFLPPLDFARQNLRNLGSNLRKFLGNRFHMKSGMKHLIERFYDSIRHDAPPPIPYAEIRTTAHIMDRVFAQLPRRNPEPRSPSRPAAS